ncbi:hypothetical protein F4821DRAFT_234420 [Hypoxylon rubiginosum]|uniref:Uncharacterized protein n=1 Tax=Hypoxylon rubiginosum TaxID=110542 RepID=A0ACC0D6P1_9PEZI|nr:hypothetical protein F4821DRAFT_234420 [Hypoxylon rubiginosum]
MPTSTIQPLATPMATTSSTEPRSLETSDIIGIAVGIPSGIFALISIIIAFCAWRYPKSPIGKVGHSIGNIVGGNARGGHAWGKAARGGDAYGGYLSMRGSTEAFGRGGDGVGGNATATNEATGGAGYGGNVTG